MNYRPTSTDLIIFRGERASLNHYLLELSNNNLVFSQSERVLLCSWAVG